MTNETSITFITSHSRIIFQESAVHFAWSYNDIFIYTHFRNNDHMRSYAPGISVVSHHLLGFMMAVANRSGQIVGMDLAAKRKRYESVVEKMQCICFDVDHCIVCVA